MGLHMMCITIQKKSVVMICRSKEHKDLNFPDLYLSEQVLNACTTAKYLGHIIINEMSDDDDMYRQCRKLYAQACNMCSDQVKINLFRASSFCTAPLRVKFKKESLCKLQVGVPSKQDGAVQVIYSVRQECNQSFPALMRNLMYKCICRIDNSHNYIIMLLTNPRLTELWYQSSLWKYWHNCLF